MIGSGTLIKVGEVYGIVTAQHVTASFGCGTKLGFILLPYEHRFFLEADHLQIVEFARPSEASQGPDLALVILPTNLLGTLKARKVFYDLSHKQKELLRAPLNLEAGLWAITGFPDEQTTRGESSRSHSYVKGFHGMAFLTGIGKQYFVGEYDFLEAVVKHRIDNTIPTTFGGVSGGGLWQIRLMKTKKGEYEVKEVFLFGVAFYQKEVTDGVRYIKCNGPRTIYKTVACLSG